MDVSGTQFEPIQRWPGALDYGNDPGTLYLVSSRERRYCDALVCFGVRVPTSTARLAAAVNADCGCRLQSIPLQLEAMELDAQCTRSIPDIRMDCVRRWRVRQLAERGLRAGPRESSSGALRDPPTPVVRDGRCEVIGTGASCKQRKDDRASCNKHKHARA